MCKENQFLACEFSPSKIYLSDYPKSLISRINEVNCIFHRPVGSNYRLGGTDGGHRYENFRAQMRNLLRLRYEKDGGKDMEIIWRTHVETMRGGGDTDVKIVEGG